MNEYKFLFAYYRFFNTSFVIVARYVIFFVFISVLFLTIQDLQIAKGVLACYILFIVNELFIHLRINKIQPHTTIDRVTESTLADAMFFRSRHALAQSRTGYDFAIRLARMPESQFLMQKITGVAQVPQSNVSTDAILKRAYALVTSVKGRYITALDLFAAYLLLSEPETKQLQKVDMMEQDLINMYYWSRNTYKVDEKNKPFSLVFRGDGTFDFFVFGWNYELKKYARSMTSQVLATKVPPSVVGRTKEYEQLLVSLSRNSSRNVVLVGEPGTGKTSLIESFAYNAYMGDIVPNLKHTHVYEILVDRLLAGVENQGQLEERLILLIAEISHSGNIVLVMQNIENIFGGGGFDFDLSGFLAEYFKGGNIMVVGTTTRGGFKTYIENKASIQSLFTVIQLQEPDEHTALFMLFEKIGKIEHQFGVHITYTGVKALVELSDTYLPERFLPGKALTILENMATSYALQKNQDRIITHEDIEAFLSAETHILLGKPTEQEKQLLLHLEDELHKRVISQHTAIEGIASALRRIRSGFTHEGRPIAAFLFLGPTGVGKTETAKALAEVYFGSREAYIRIDMSEYASSDGVSKLLGEHPGETVATRSFLDDVIHNPFSLILLDEFEKANAQVLNLFLQVFEDGRLTDNQGRTISFQNTIIIATSNAGSEYIRTHQSEITSPTFHKSLITMLLEKRMYTPELLNRFDEIMVFNSLTKEDISRVATLLLQEAFAVLKEKQMSITFDARVVEKVVADSYDVEFGARAVRRYIDGVVSEFIAKKILANEIQKGMSVTLSVDADGNFHVT